MKKVALVTGGVGGIGSAICKILAKSGHTVISTFFSSEEKANQWLIKNKSEGFDFKIFKCDVSDFEACKSLVANIKQEFGSVDVLVNNAGITSDQITSLVGSKISGTEIITDSKKLLLTNEERNTMFGSFIFSLIC